MKRPGPVRWLLFQYGVRLPGRYRDWVLHDATCRTWLPRVLFRTLVQLAPAFAVVLAVLLGFDGGWAIALGALLLGVLVSLRLTLANAAESVDARLVRYGFPPGHATAVRGQAGSATHEAEEKRYRDKWRQPEST
ncbi:DUF5313 family protein [Actinophytocola glycyrrhizae]|uniref:DUF5313 family protein n=1 Tax=Actinophytocola glycyrrhizae TaxID=2044873 RepID=A0ABV9S2J7_9PSEU